MSAVMIETFECNEVAHEPIEIAEEASGLIESLGLEGQANYVAKVNEKVTQRCPYRLITAEEMAVYRILCPEATKIEKYDAAPIPLRVLQLAAHAKVVISGVRLMVWDKVKHAVKDPVLVGEIGYEWRPEKTYILARWGEQLDAFATMMAQAAEAVRQRLQHEGKRFIDMIAEATPEEVLTHRDVVFPKQA